MEKRRTLLVVVTILVGVSTTFLGCSSSKNEPEYNVAAVDNTTTSATTTTTAATQTITTTVLSNATATTAQHVHTYKRVVSKPDCITPGFTTYTCNCGHSYQDDYVKSLGHKWSEWTLVRKATTKVGGQYTRSCSACDLVDFWNTSKLPPRFTKSIEACKTSNVKYETGYENEYEFAAVVEMYACGYDNAAAEKRMKKVFKSTFGFAATAEITKEYVGEFMVDGCESAQKVYLYTIFDTTYPLFDAKPYTVFHQTCADGSPWVGFAVLATMDTLPAEENTPRFEKLYDEMLAEFEKVMEMSIKKMQNNRDKYDIGIISQAGTMRTKDGTLIDVLYIYCRDHADA